MEYRPFQNSDPPQLLKLWHDCGLGRGAAMGFSGAAFEILVLSHLYFDRFGLILAIEDGKLAGALHAGFGCLPDESNLDYSSGVISGLMVRPEYRHHGVAQELLRQGEEYLRSRGAKSIQAGGAYPNDPFYVGLYGGSLLPGFLKSDPTAETFFKQSGYEPIAEHIVFQRDLGFRNEPYDYRTMNIRRTSQFAISEGPPKLTWWWVSRFGAFDFIRFTLQSKTQNKLLAEVYCHSMDLFARSGDQRVVAMTGLWVNPEERGKGYAKALLLDVFRKLREEAVTRIEMQTQSDNSATIHLLSILNCEQIDSGTVYRKISQE
ncbi:MAG: GNAT family N-acetyltransferase [Planctomycetaceae bacterium]|nr:GNAT family N-acetyltransferase [Planctomycetaceae bacterium]